MSRIFTKEYLDKLQDKMKEIDVLTYMMNHHELTFQEAIEDISKFLSMEPQFIGVDMDKKIKKLIGKTKSLEKGEKALLKEDKVHDREIDKAKAKLRKK
jgi:hypothetical protein